MDAVLNDIVPDPDFTEVHERWIDATPEAVYRSLRELTLGEVPIAGVLFRIRSLPALVRGRHGLPATADRPMLEQFSESGFTMLADIPRQEIAIGVVSQMWRIRGSIEPIADRSHFEEFSTPDFAKAAMTFVLRPDAGGTLVRTETRVVATSEHARRAFSRYWLLIRPFSGLIRRVWLGAVSRRAVAG